MRLFCLPTLAVLLQGLLSIRVQNCLGKNSVEENAVRKEKIRYLLFEKENNSLVEMKRDGVVPNATWIPDGNIKVIVHGWSFQTWEDSKKDLEDQKLLDIGKEYSKTEKSLNIILMDWTIFAKTEILEYPLAVESVKDAGLDLAEYLICLKKAGHISSLDKVHLIGYSLGAHTSGVAGYQVQQKGSDPIGRITGLDPAGPLCDGPNGQMPKDTSKFLEKSDAKFVDIIHCNMGTPPTWLAAANVYGRMGSYVQAGHADFYPNGGETQPGCSLTTDRIGCSHKLCPVYFARTIREELWACSCDNWTSFKNGKCPCKKGEKGQLMGDKCETSASGKYFLQVT